MTSAGENSILLILLAAVTPPPTMPCCCCTAGSTSVLRPPSVAEGDGGTGGEETGEGFRVRNGERAVDSAFWEASRADTASELSRCTVAWASSVMSITLLPWRWDNEGVWDRDEAAKEEHKNTQHIDTPHIVCIDVLQWTVPFTVFLLPSNMLAWMVSGISGICCRGDWVICVTATNSSSSFVIILPVSMTTPFLLSSVA